MNNGVQKTINFTRAAQLGIIREFCKRLPPKIEYESKSGSDKCKIKSVYVVSVLKAIDDRAGQNGFCSTSYETMANDAQVSERHAKRVVNWLEQNSLVIKTRTKTSNRLKLVFSNLTDFCITECHRQTTECQGGFTECQGDTTECHTGVYRVPQEAHKAPLRSAQRSAHTKKRSSGVERRRNIFVDRDAIQPTVDRVLHFVSCGKPNDFWLTTTVASMAVYGLVSENDFEIVLETIAANRSTIDNEAAYFRQSIIEQAFDGSGDRFEQAAKRLRIPKRSEVSNAHN